MDKNWVEIIPPIKRNFGEAEYEKWKVTNKELFKSLKPEDIRINYIRGKEGNDLIQYLINTEVKSKN